MYLVAISFEKYVSASPSAYLFYWHTAGGAHHKFITEEPEALIAEIAKNALKYPNFKRRINSIDDSLRYFREKAEIEELPKTLEIFDIINEFLEIDYRVCFNDVIEVTTHMPGKIIGKQGRVIKAIKKHLDREIRVVPAYLFTISLDGGRAGKARVRIDSKTILEIPVDEAEALAFKVYRDPRYGFSVSRGYIAPWHIERW